VIALRLADSRDSISASLPRSWNKAVAQATAMETPYELAEAHFELATHLGETQG